MDQRQRQKIEAIWDRYTHGDKTIKSKVVEMPITPSKLIPIEILGNDKLGYMGVHAVVTPWYSDLKTCEKALEKEFKMPEGRPGR